MADPQPNDLPDYVNGLPIDDPEQDPNLLNFMNGNRLPIVNLGQPEQAVVTDFWQSLTNLGTQIVVNKNTIRRYKYFVKQGLEKLRDRINDIRVLIQELTDLIQQYAQNNANQGQELVEQKNKLIEVITDATQKINLWTAEITASNGELNTDSYQRNINKLLVSLEEAINKGNDAIAAYPIVGPQRPPQVAQQLAADVPALEGGKKYRKSRKSRKTRYNKKSRKSRKTRRRKMRGGYLYGKTTAFSESRSGRRKNNNSNKRTNSISTSFSSNTNPYSKNLIIF